MFEKKSPNSAFVLCDANTARLAAIDCPAALVLILHCSGNGD